MPVARVSVVANRWFIGAETVGRITRVYGTSVVIVAKSEHEGTGAVSFAGIFGTDISVVAIRVG